MKKRESYLIELHRPESVSVAQLKQYMEDAIACWRGGLSPSEFDDADWRRRGAIRIKRMQESPENSAQAEVEVHLRETK